MVRTQETLARLAAIPELTVLTGAPLSLYTRFAIGGPADIYAETGDTSLLEPLQAIWRSLIVSARACSIATG